MQCTGYYRILNCPQNDIEDLSDSLIVNCTGQMNKSESFSNDMKMGRSDFYLLYMTEGEMTVYFDDHTAIFKSGMVLFYYPKTRYRYTFDKDGIASYYWVHFTGNQAHAMMKRFGFQNELILDIGVHTSVTDLFKKMASEFICREPDFSFSAATYLLQILVRIRRYTEKPVNTHAKKLRKSLEFLHSQYHTPITIEELAAIEGMSASRYRVLFHQVTGISPKQYLTDIRIRHACELLCQTNLKVSQIAPMVGYDDLLYFDRIFKKRVNATPTQYREFYSVTLS